MTDAPNSITAWSKSDGSTVFEGGNLFPKGVAVDYTRTLLVKHLVDALRELTTCVEDGCYCSEMRMAAAVDEANAALASFEEGKS